ncbi:MAG: holo-[acyl-carrier-protein] synthase [Gemmatimonadetes bacterium RBG_16_66_8]|nr:MAG: holo-[acyl-carrier-protein] synthase [Gemmatimonadetes bacterium RBG_16_66_8]
MVPLGVGIDLVDVARVERMLDQFGHRVLDRLLTEGERAYCLSMAVPARHVAARVAAKEAAFKALQPDDGRIDIGWREIEVVRNHEGQPSLALQGRARKRSQQLGVRRVMVSLSHSDLQAAAVVMLLG